ncbi:BgTH12-03303 [Blumeria graminis f. sp. triticale]|nr:BgTH12-03303 [Blumeria graminis f. sp. triticale]
MFRGTFRALYPCILTPSTHLPISPTFVHTAAEKMAQSNRLLIYVMRRDLRVTDNPILHELTKTKHGFTHLLPLYTFSAEQIEVSGFLQSGAQSPYPEARSKVGSFFRCGPHRAKFILESVIDVKKELENLGSGLCIRVGMLGEVVEDLLTKFASNKVKVAALWMTSDHGYEEKIEEIAVHKMCQAAKVGFRLFADEKYLIDDRDLPFDNFRDLPDVFTSFRKSVEPLRSNPRKQLPAPQVGSLPQCPEIIPPQLAPFAIPESSQGLQEALLKPLHPQAFLRHPPTYPSKAISSFPLKGGCSHALDRLHHLLSTSCITDYHETRNGLLGADYSTKLSPYLALGCITARQIHHSMLSFENGTNSDLSSVHGYGEGENSGTKAARFELLWRDYMRLCAKKFGLKLFRLSGFKGPDSHGTKWQSPNKKYPVSLKPELQEKIDRFLNGTTGMGLVDAAMRELFHTGFTSNRTRQNVASYLAKHLNIDWRIGAEWYECMLIDHDVSSNWGNWQYVAGVGNDPRGSDRVFNPVKQAFDYDPIGEYIKTWCPELRAPGLRPSEIYQAWTIDESRREGLGLKGLVQVEKPLRMIQYTNHGRGRGQRPKQYQRTGPLDKESADYGGYGYGSTRGHLSSSRGRGRRSRG